MAAQKKIMEITYDVISMGTQRWAIVRTGRHGRQDTLPMRYEGLVTASRVADSLRDARVMEV